MNAYANLFIILFSEIAIYKYIRYFNKLYFYDTIMVLLMGAIVQVFGVGSWILGAGGGVGG